MIRLAISPAAYAAIASTLPGSVGVEPQRAPNGDYLKVCSRRTSALMLPASSAIADTGKVQRDA
ncbi:MAG TPA: hypothetical protein VFE60_02570 [Roseiarcus sp.]|nr:hypothetical protein [Roseiarcus sp.]